MLEAAILCLALNIWHEARGEPLKGQFAVALVTMNRAKVPERICTEVYKPSQFSWTDDQGKRGKYPHRDNKQWIQIKKIAELVVAGSIFDITHGATFYHADYVRPYWSTVFTPTKQIGRHIFYRA